MSRLDGRPEPHVEDVSSCGMNHKTMLELSFVKYAWLVAFTFEYYLSESIHYDNINLCGGRNL